MQIIEVILLLLLNYKYGMLRKLDLKNVFVRLGIKWSRKLNFMKLATAYELS